MNRNVILDLGCGSFPWPLWSDRELTESDLYIGMDANQESLECATKIFNKNSDFAKEFIGIVLGVIHPCYGDDRVIAERLHPLMVEGEQRKVNDYGLMRSDYCSAPLPFIDGSISEVHLHAPAPSERTEADPTTATYDETWKEKGWSIGSAGLQSPYVNSQPELLKEVYRVLKPGGHFIAKYDVTTMQRLRISKALGCLTDFIDIDRKAKQEGLLANDWIVKGWHTVYDGESHADSDPLLKHDYSITLDVFPIKYNATLCLQKKERLP